MRTNMPVERILPPVAAALLCAAVTGCASNSTGSRRGGYASSGALLVTIDDGDLGPRLFVDGTPEPRTEGAKDTITVVRLPIPDPGDLGARVEWSQTLAPSSAAGAYGCLAVSADGGLAAVASTGVSVEYPEPGRVTIVDLRAGGVPGATRIVGAIDGPPGLCAIAFRPEGAELAMLSSDGAVWLAPVHPDGVGEIQSCDAAAALGAGWPAGSRATGFAWSPAGDRLAVTIAGADSLGVFSLSIDDAGARLKSVGPPAGTRANPSFPSWTPDGRLVVISERALPPFVKGVVQRSASGTLGLYRTEPGASPLRISEVRLERGADALALSPDGRVCLIAARRPSDEIDRADRLGGTLTLVAIDAVAGGGRVVAGARCSSFPAGVAFDPSGRSAMVCDFLNNEVQVWRVVSGSKPSVQYTGVNVGVGAGPHAVCVTR